VKIKHEYRDYRGLIIDPTYVTKLLERTGKTEDEWQSFIGDPLWTTDGFATPLLQNYLAMKEWVLGKGTTT